MVLRVIKTSIKECNFPSHVRLRSKVNAFNIFKKGGIKYDTESDSILES